MSDIHSMLSNDEIIIVKKLIKSKFIYDWFKCNDKISVVLYTMPKMKITIVDDFVIEDMPDIVITFKDDNVIEHLTIIVKSGKYHNKNEIIGYDDDLHTDFDKCRLTVECHNTVNNLIVQQKMCTENIYSYYGNQDGFSTGNISIEYDVNKYKKIRCSGQMSVESQECSNSLIVSVN